MLGDNPCAGVSSPVLAPALGNVSSIMATHSVTSRYVLPRAPLQPHCVLVTDHVTHNALRPKLKTGCEYLLDFIRFGLKLVLCLSIVLSKQLLQVVVIPKLV